MMGPGDGYPGQLHPNLPNAHHSVPMDLHVPQGFPYYRCRNESFCWPERQPFDPSTRFPSTSQPMPPILELRKEKSRDAARSRRGKENYEFYELAKMLPLPAAITSQLDKASIIRLTISYLRIKDFSSHGDPPWLRENPALNKKGNVRSVRSSGSVTLDLFEQHQGTHILQSLDGFAFALAADGRFLYISETVSIYLGLSQVEMTGSSVFDYIHPNDHAELAEQLGLGLSHGPGTNVPSPAGSDDGSSNSATNNPDVSSLMSITSNAGYKGLDRAFCIRMKSTLTKRGCHFKSSGYRVVLVLCRLRAQYSFSLKRGTPPPLLGMVALAIALPPPSVHEIRLESDMFVTKVTFDLRIIHCEPRVSELLDYTSEELMGRNLYALCHAEDVNKLRKCHVDLLDKGQVMSQYYRLLNKNGGYLWIQTCATIVSNSKNSDEQNIICVNYVISGKEYTYMVMDCCQLEQECLPTVKREAIADDDRDKKSTRSDSAGGSSSCRETSSTLGSSNKRTPSESVRSPDLTDDISALNKRTGNEINRLADVSTSTLGDSTPSTDDQTNRTRYPSRSIDSEPFGIPLALEKSQQPTQLVTKGRKRKSEKPNQNQNNILPNSPINESISLNSDPKFITKRQIIVPNEAVDNNDNLALNSMGAKIYMGTPVSSANLICQEIGSKLNSEHMTEVNMNSDPVRTVKHGNHQGHAQWDSSSGSSSVKRLEQVMSKHLPGQEIEHIPAISTSGIDFSTDSLLSQRTGSRVGSAIQDSESGHGLPVSTLLRQLCASRESVIRANVQAAALTTRGGSSYYQDMCTVQSALPTPPGSDSYGGEPQFMLGTHHNSTVAHKKSSSTYFPSLVPYPTVSSTDSQPSLTPPASVSPRDKRSYSSSTGTTDTVNSYGESSSISSNSTSFRPPPHLYMDGPAQPLPLKPQVYGYHPHSSLESQYGNPFGDHTQSQLYAPPHTGFHLYHPGKPSYGEALKNANWY